MEINVNEKQFSNSIFIIPVDDNYHLNKKRNSFSNKTNTLKTNNIFINNHIHMIHSYVTYYKQYYVNHIQMQIQNEIKYLPLNKITPQRKYTYTPSFAKNVFK